MTELEVAWLAGLLEGEACFYLDSKGRRRIDVSMTDLDVLERARAIVGSGGLHARKLQPRCKQTWCLNINGHAALEVMTRVLPYLGERRAAKVRHCLENGPKARVAA